MKETHNAFNKESTSLRLIQMQIFYFLLNCELIFLSGSAMGVLVLGFNASQASTLAATSLKSQRKSFSRLANYFDLSTTKAVLKK